MWLGMISPIFPNQNADMRVSTSPFPGMGFGMTKSKAEMRSLATISKWESSE